MTDMIVRRTEALRGEVCASASKAYTQRMLIAAALSQGTSKISNPLLSEDTQAAIRAVTALGAKVKTSQADCWTVEGAKELKGASKPINCGESGATLRFMIPVAALAPTPSTFSLGKGLSKRPVEPLLDCLKQLGVKSEVKTVRGRVSIHVEGGGIQGGKATLPGDVSSQFVSGLMFACPLAKADTALTLSTPLESKSYVLMTENVLSKHQITADIAEDFSKVKIPANQTYKPQDARVPGDFSSAAFLLCAAAVTNSTVTVKNLDFASVQGDKAIMRILQLMGVNGKVCQDSIEITGQGEEGLKVLDVDARDIPDLVPVCAALACYANGVSKIHDAQRLRLKESDRLNSLFVELQKMGAVIEMDESSLTIKGPCKLHGATLDPHNDHRIAMACAVAALGAKGETVIQNAQCVRKSYPQFFTDLRSLGADVDGGEFDR
ncbi:MAG: 3-phosphoshikimate 1-carboxyvinyltransferase [Candidatus Bathyarchaeota archaeon]|nr:3-phosphoshikimate 1-carboxyvinyltransferase [Candidatus Bathyarchaeota archaeon]